MFFRSRISPNNPQALRDTLVKLPRASLAGIGEEAYKLFTSRFTEKTMGAKIAALYDDVLKERPIPA